MTDLSNPATAAAFLVGAIKTLGALGGISFLACMAWYFGRPRRRRETRFSYEADPHFPRSWDLLRHERRVITAEKREERRKGTSILR